MPAIVSLLPVIFGAIGASATATEAGLAIHNALTAPGAPPATNPMAGPTPTQSNQITSAVGNSLPTIQSQLGGSVSPEYYLQIGQLLNGFANQPGASGSAQSALNNFLGSNSTSSFTPAGLSPQSNYVVGTGLTDLGNSLGIG